MRRTGIRELLPLAYGSERLGDTPDGRLVNLIRKVFRAEGFATAIPLGKTMTMTRKKREEVKTSSLRFGYRFLARGYVLFTSADSAVTRQLMWLQPA